MKLFCWELAPYSKKALVAAYEKGISFEREQVTPYDKAQMGRLRKEHYPLATVPLLLLDDGTYLTDATTIAEHFDLIGETGPALVPREPHEALRVRAHDRFADSIFTPTVYLTWAYHKEKLSNDKTKQAFEQLETALRLLDQRLVGREFVCADTYTLADISSASGIATALQDRSIELDTYPQIARWYRSLQGRDSWRRLTSEASALPMPF